jgi:methylase of polypeptide subunit release factors
MKAERFNTLPVQALLEKHAQHTEPYMVDFLDRTYIILPDVFNPTYTKVSGFLARNIEIYPGETLLEMFCGSGAVGLSVAEKAGKLVGIDISPHAVSCSRKNADMLGINGKTDFRQGSLWEPIRVGEQFDLIIANPPLLPAIPESWLERAVADSPEMSLTKGYISGLPKHLTNSGRALMAFSNACSVIVGDPLAFINEEANLANLNWTIKEEWDVGYEIYRVIQFTK